MDDLIPVVNKLQDVFALVGGSNPVDLPQIVVVGSQSSGKSSVLENVVGRDFLPRGQGIVTRRPLVLQLIHNAAREKPKETTAPEAGSSGDKLAPVTDGDEWGEFLHMQGQKFFDFNEIRAEIERETDRVTGKNKGVSEKAIRLRVYSPNVVNLTLVDLPGMTKVPVGDQPQDIEQQIRKMIQTYITNPNSIILAVSSANTDLANSDALKIAREVDPAGNRTIGVITKLDLMDAGTDAMDMLMGRTIPLRLGFIGLVNRSQQDINNKKDIKRSLEDERLFFERHPIYRTIAAKCGTQFLSRRLNTLLLTHIREVLPDIRSRVAQNMAELQTELLEYGDPVLSSSENKGALLLQLLTKYSSTFCDAIDGKSKELSTTELYGGARINFIFTDSLPLQLSNINPVEHLSVQDIRTAIRNATGTRQTLFVPEVSFELLAKQQISRLEDPALRCCHQVYDEMIRIVSQCQPKEMMRFTNLRDRVIDVSSNLLTQALEPTRKMVSNLIQIELAYINTSHPDFIGGNKAVAQLMQRRGGGPVPTPTNPPSIGGTDSQPPVQTNQVATAQSRPQPPQTTVATAESSQGFLSGFFGSSATPASSNPATQKRPVTPSVNTISRVPTQPYTNSSSSFASPWASAGTGDMLPPQMRAQTAQLSEHERIVTEIITMLLQSYFAIVLKNIQDSVPKAIMYFLVNHVKDNIQHQLVASLYKQDMLDELLEEADQIGQRRRQCVETIDLLRSALDIINQVKEASYR
eukprot:c2920_g1_i1.p1 GENE.c2920_g1_i1~~c2920_g1_i1.p1  ORF type:complete len:750 (+),score=179.65 c2920_g1_i1:84-2333(+)